MKIVNFREYQRNPVQRVFFVPIERISLGRHGAVIVDYGTHREAVKVHDDDLMAVHEAIQKHAEKLAAVPIVGSQQS